VQGTMFESDHYGDLHRPEAFLAQYSISDSGNVEFSWGQQFQGSGQGEGESIHAVVSHNGLVFAAGTTEGPFQGSYQGGKDVFVVCLDGSGSKKWGAQIGSSSDDWVRVAAADSTGVYVAGMTVGNMYAKAAGESDAFVVKLDLTSGGVIWGQQLGSFGDDYVTAINLISPKVVEISGPSSGLFPPSRGGFKATYNTETGAFLEGASEPHNREDVLEVIGRHGVYTLTTEMSDRVHGGSRASVVQVLGNPCAAGTKLHADKGSYPTSSPRYKDLSCQECTYGVSAAFSTECQRCYEGTVPGKDKTKCEACPAGTYSEYSRNALHEEWRCEECPGFQWSESGSWHCTSFKWPLPLGSIGFVVLSLLWFVSVLVLVFRVLHVTPGMRGMIILSTTNVLLDQLFTFTGVFNRRIYLILCTIFVVLPVLHYTYFVLRLLDPSKPFRPRFLLPRPAVLTHIWHLSVKDGLPQWDGVSYYVTSNQQVLEEGDVENSSVEAGNGGEGGRGGSSETGSDALCGHRGKVVAVWTEAVLKQLLFMVAWVTVHLLYLTPWYLLHFLFYLTGYIVGFYLFQFKLLHLKKVKVLWKEAMMSGKSEEAVMTMVAEVDSDFDVRSVNTCVLAEGVFQACPQYILQLINMLKISGHSVVPMASLVTSGVFVLYHLFRVAYWHVWQRIGVLDMPVLWLFSSEEEVAAALERLAAEADARRHGRKGFSDEEECERSPLILQYEERAMEMTAMIDTQKAVNRKLVEEQEVMMRKLAALEGAVLVENQPARRHAHGVGDVEQHEEEKAQEEGRDGQSVEVNDDDKLKGA